MNPYKIDEPALISFSGGRTSGFMLWKILQAYNGKLPEDIWVVFANTGKEAPETLDFINDVSEKWGVHINWLELSVHEERPIWRTKQVNYKTASRCSIRRASAGVFMPSRSRVGGRASAPDLGVHDRGRRHSGPVCRECVPANLARDRN